MAENPYDQFDAIQPSLPAAQIKPIIAAPVKPEKGESAPSGYRYNAAGVLEPIPGGPADPNAPKPGAEKPTEAQGKVLTLLTRVAGGASDIQSALKAEPEAQQAGLLETLSRNILGEGVVTRTIAGPERRIITDAQADILDGLLTLGTGAAYSREQLIGQTISYFPQYGDTKEEIAVKNDRLQRLITAARIQAGPLAAEFDKSIKPLLGETAAPPAESAAPPPPAGTLAPIEAGQAVQTEQDIAKQQQLQQAWNSGATVDQMVQLSQQLGVRPFGEDELSVMRSQREKGGPVNFYVEPTGTPSITQGTAGAILSTPVGEAVGGYATGAANALLFGGLDELAPVLGLSPQQVQIGKEYLRQQAPVASFGGEVTGGVLGAIPMVRGAQAALAGTRFAGAAPLLGETAYGTLYGAGEAPEGQRLAGAAVGGGLTLGTGALANRFLPGGPGTFTGMAPEVPAGAVMPDVPISTAAEEAALSQRRYDIQMQLRNGPGSPELERESLEISRQLRDLQMPAYMRPGYVPPRRDIPMVEPMPASTTSEEAILSQRYRDIQDQLRTGQGSPALEQESLAITTRLRWLQTPEYMKEGVIEPPPIQGLSPQSTAPAAASPAPTPEMAVELGKIIREASAGTTRKAKAAQVKLAEMAQVNPEARAAAERLGIELPADVFSDNPQVRAAVGLTRSLAGSEAEAAWRTAVTNAVDQADNVIRDFDAQFVEGAISPATVSQRVKDSLTKTRADLNRQASRIYQQVDEAVPKNSVIQMDNLKTELGKISDEVGGPDGFTQQEARLFKMVTGKDGVTYGRMMREKNLIGKALKKQESPYGSMDEATLKRLYAALSQDQLDNVGAIAGEEMRAQLRGANLIYAKERALGERIVNAFGRDLEGGIANKMRAAITGAAKGDPGEFTRLMKAVPDDLKKEVVATALASVTRSARGAERGGFGFAEFADLYPKLRANPPVFKTIVETLGPKSADTLRDLFEVSKRITDARANVLTTGKANQALVESLNAEGLIARIMDSTTAKRVAGAAAGAAGPIAGAVMPDIMAAMSKGNPDAIRAAGKMFVSPEFQTLLTEAATQPEVSQKAINRVVSSQRFRDFANTIKLDMKQARNWLRSMATVGGVGMVEGGPEEGAIVVRQQ